ncbi:hypothetical protein [Sinomonas sp. RB5]
METMRIPAKTTFAPLGVPPRCRNPRPVPRTFEHSVQVRSYTGAEAPVVARVHLRSGRPVELRQADGVFYRPADEEALPDSMTVDAQWSRTASEAIGAAVERVRGRVLIDGQMWQAAGEPVYQVMTFGLGDNHGSSILDPRLTWAGEDLEQASYLSGLDRVRAVAAAVEVAVSRGDSLSVDRIRDWPPIEVLDPSVFTLQPAAARREAAVAEAREMVALAAGAVQAAAPEDLGDALQTLEKTAAAARETIYRSGI